MNETLLDIFPCFILFGCVVSEQKMYMQAANGRKIYPPMKFCQK